MAFLRGFGKYLPERVADNAEIAALVGAEPDWIREMSGIETRRFARPDETVAEMAHHAAAMALERSGLVATDIDLILLSSGTGERRFPGPAAELQSRLGAGQAVAMDVPMASAGALFAMAQASVMAARYPRILVVASEKMSPIVASPPIEKGTAMLFGDGAGACVVDATQGWARMVDFELGTDGTNSAELRLNAGEPVYMNGRMVIMHAARKVPAAIEKVLARASRTAAQVPTFLMHQANANLITKIAQTLGVEPQRFYSNIQRYGNTSSASLLIAACEWLETGAKLEPGTPLIFSAFGAGFHWGALLVEGAD